jgi:exosortase
VEDTLMRIALASGLAAPARARPASRVVLTVALTLALAIAYVPAAGALARVWRDVNYYSYGCFIPFFSAYLAWEARRRIAGPAVGSLAGLGVIAAGLGLLAVGSASASLTIEVLSMPVSVAGLGLFRLGPARFREIRAPVAFLALMTPLPRPAIDALSLPLQWLAALFTGAALDALGIHAVRHGLLIHLDGVSIEVSEACNGLRFLLAMIVVGAAFAWLTQRGALRRGAVVALAVVTAIAANLVRVAGTAVLAHAWGAGAASGAAHVAYGKVVYALMLVPFAAIVVWLRRGDREAGEAPGVTA